ncbi:hypothetical protein K443DRAFT_9808 [Laccaria amethystina LaAM-08-1]|uniref:Alpha/beta-hydrolase n=1 Tax=Laccaria amethystina LaAM-08-1 TaxID=1095629 RepID=A0A0C9X856_9AGAR|nr:hypothetical protein K443DRAFT_9808 [Laccaria amethystina LaAM-08-1]
MLDTHILLGSYPPRTKEIIDSTYPLLEATRAAMESIVRKTFDYGPIETHKLDVYYPPEHTDGTTQTAPILVFFYGGGLVTGSRSSPPSNLVYNNLGAYFASRGILTVIPDYRLVPGITYPQGSKDHLASLGDDNSTHVFVLAHSAGGMHVSGYLLTDLFASSPAAHIVRGVAFMGVPFETYPSQGKFYAVAETYYGDRKKIAQNQPLGILRRMEPSRVASLPPLRNYIAGSEPRAISSSMRNFAKEWEKKGGVVEVLVMDGHDHLSPVLALSSGSGEEWGEDLVAWIGSS